MGTMGRVGVVVSLLTPLVTLTGCADEVYCADGVCYGYYYDSLVTGLSYESQGDAGEPLSGLTGEANDPGRFSYRDGHRVTFSLGDTVLGQSGVLASSKTPARVTPFDLAGVPEEAVGGCAVDEALREDEFRIVQNIAVLLQTFDTDGDPTNGIDISSGVAALFDGVSVSLDQAWGDFQADSDLQGVLEEANNQQLFSDARALVAREDALRALYQGIGLCEDGSGGTGGTGGDGGTGGTGGTGTADCSGVTPGNGEFGAACRNDGDCSGGLPCCTSTEVSAACGTTAELCTCI
jgi:hypothetical protein